MAIHAHSTTAPALQPRLLRPFTFRPTPPVDDPRSVDELLEEIRRTIEGQVSGHVDPKPELPPKPLLQPADQARALHMWRELHQALDHGFALLDALDLPPLALDVIDDAIATLDALEAPDEDREDDDPAEGTSLERHGSGFLRCGTDDAEEDDGCERGEEYGSEDGEDIGHHASQFRPFPLSHTERTEVAIIAARAQAMRRVVHV